MNLLPANEKLVFEVTYDSPLLYVAMSVYDVTGGSPSLVSGPSPMTVPAGNTYIAPFVAQILKKYLVLKAVYTDGTFTTFHPDYPQSSETFTSEVFSSTQASDIDGTVDDVTSELTGEFDDC